MENLVDMLLKGFCLYSFPFLFFVNYKLVLNAECDESACKFVGLVKELSLKVLLTLIFCI